MSYHYFSGLIARRWKILPCAFIPRVPFSMRVWMAVPCSVTGKPKRSVHHATKYVKNDLTLRVSPFVVFPSIQSHDLHVFFDAQNTDLVKSSKEQN